MVRINDDYVILVDKDNYTLAKDLHKVGKKKNALYKPLGFYMSLVDALEAYIERSNKEILSNGENQLTEALTQVVNNIMELKTAIEKAIPEAKVTLR